MKVMKHKKILFALLLLSALLLLTMIPIIRDLQKVDFNVTEYRMSIEEESREPMAEEIVFEISERNAQHSDAEINSTKE